MSFDNKYPTNITGSDSATYYTLISPELRGIGGLELIFSAMIAISAAASEVKFIRRSGSLQFSLFFLWFFLNLISTSGFRILASVEDYDFNQIKKITQQYMKFESVFESIIPHSDGYSSNSGAWEVNNLL